MASARWQRRNARARALGYSSYYDYRVHHYGQRPPSEPRARGPALRRLRGHTGAADINSLLRARRIEMVNLVQTEYDPPEFEINAVLTNGRTRVFTLRGEGQIADWNDELDDMDDADVPMIVGSPKSIAALRAGGVL